MPHFGSLMKRSDSWLHFGLGALTVFTTPYVAAGYGASHVAGLFDTAPVNDCPNSIVQGAEYGLGYFAVLLAFQTFTDLAY